jgi:N-acetylglucosaminyl-diphospho-decaprenol L-rhamnosyltransferase
MSVVVVSYNTKTLTLQCLESLCRNVPEGTEVCVVDNASVDHSAIALQEFARTQATPVRVLSAHRNLGFGAANNLGAGSTSGEFIALVNSDAFVREGVLHGLREYLRRTPKAAAVGPQLENVDGSFQESRFPFPTPARAWVENLGLARLGRCFKPKKPLIAGPVQWLSGACLMIRRTVWERIGGFDERFFLYAEETDLQRRIADRGWEIHWAPDFVVTHIGGSSGLAEREAVREHFFAGADRYIQRYHGILGVWMFRTATCAGAVLRWVWSVWRGGRGGKAARRWAWILRRQIARPLPKDFGPPAGCSLTPATADSPRCGESPTE